MRSVAGLVVAVCVLALLWVLARAVFRAVRPQGAGLAVVAAAGAAMVAYALLGALVR